MLSGTVKGTYESDSWKLHEDDGDRTATVFQAFSPPFSRPPVVSVSFSELDAPAGPLRARVYAEDITTAGFNVKFETWADSKLYAAVAAWIAYEP
jgi:hypothetical protein